ncbi:MAG: LytTR family DNA-binding domain-containing protein [Acutalibacteraceae bacterium]|nr:LytTR family DNA-binding domain-containing protein [Acutalibacteraceae bacterium]
MLFAVCDDDKNIANYIKNQITKIHPTTTEIVIFNSASELTDYVKHSRQPNAIFMDICLNNENGINELRKVSKHILDVPVIFITGYTEYSQDIFIDFKPWGLLLKPIDNNKLEYYIKKLYSLYGNKPSSIFITVNGKQIKLPINDILFIESNKRKVIYHTINSKFEEYIKLDSAVEKLGTVFLRCHKSFAVNLNYVTEFSKSKIMLSTGREISVSRSYYQSSKVVIFEHKALLSGV